MVPTVEDQRKRPPSIRVARPRPAAKINKAPVAQTHPISHASWHVRACRVRACAALAFYQ
jgi:hypothetical protein